MTQLQNTLTEPDGTLVDGWLDVDVVGNPFRAGSQSEVLGPIKDHPIEGGSWVVQLTPGLYTVTQRRRDGSFHSRWTANVPDSTEPVWLADVLVELPGTPSSTPLLGVSGVVIDGAGHLVVSYTDGTTQDVGVVVGPQGPPYTGSAAEFDDATAALVPGPSATADALRAASGTYTGDRTWTGDHVFQGGVDLASATVTGAPFEALVARTGAATGDVPVLQGDGTLAFGPPSGGGPFEAKISLNVKADFGAVGDGVTDDSAAFAAAATAAKNSLRTLPYSLQADKSGGVLITVPPGDYLITNPGAFLGDEAMTEKGVGLGWRGAGKGISNIIFKPAAAGALISNDYWQVLDFQDLTFHAATPGCTFMQSYTTHAAQSYSFTNVRWRKFKYGIDLQGDNNNSEFLFIGCDSFAFENAGAFLYIGATNTVDQFLNYWFYGCTHQSTSAPFIDAARGGHFHLYGLDASDWGAALAAPGYLFALRGTAHSQGVCMFEAHGVRVEAKHAQAALLYSEWPQGNVTFRSADWSSQSDSFTYGDIIVIDHGNTAGPVYSFVDSTLAGGVKIKFGTNAWQHVHKVVFDRCDWLQRNSPTDVVTYDTSAAGTNGNAKPPVRFVDCRARTTAHIFNTTGTGALVWNATVGYRGQLMQTLEPRVLSLRAIAGSPPNGEILRFTLPVDAIITGFQALSPAGAVTEADGGTWTLTTTEGTPTTVATITVPGAMSAGYDVSAAMPIPFRCDTAAKATLVITPSNVAQFNPGGLLLVKGYW